jgi:hypothetical protein
VGKSVTLGVCSGTEIGYVGWLTILHFFCDRNRMIAEKKEALFLGILLLEITNNFPGFSFEA